MEVVDEFCDLLQNHANRDKVVSLSCYLLKLWGASAQSKPLLSASARLAGARATLRLFDDAAALRTALKYGLGRQEGLFWGSLGVSSGALQLAYLQAEKLVWLLDTGLVVLPQTLDYRVRTAHKVLWVLMASVGLLRSIRAVHISAKEVASSRPRKCASARLTQATVVAAKLALDVAHAGSWLPTGWLWGGRMAAQPSAAVATASAVLGNATLRLGRLSSVYKRRVAHTHSALGYGAGLSQGTRFSVACGGMAGASWQRQQARPAGAAAAGVARRCPAARLAARLPPLPASGAQRTR